MSMHSDYQAEFPKSLAQVTKKLAANLVCDAQMAVHQAIEIVAE